MTSMRHTWRTVAGLSMAIMMLCVAVPGAAQPNGATLWVAWTATGDDGLTGQAWQCDLRYSTTPVGGSVPTWWNQAIQVSGEPSPSPSGVVDSVLVTGLSPGTTYYFVLRIGDEALNWSNYSNATSAQTTGSPPPPPPPPAPGGDDSSDLNAFPNPASGPVRFELRVAGTDSRPVRIRIFDLNGHVVADLANSTFPPGVSSITWDRLGTSGNTVAPGYYEVMGTVGPSRVRVRLLLLP